MTTTNQYRGKYQCKHCEGRKVFDNGIVCIDCSGTGRTRGNFVMRGYEAHELNVHDCKDCLDRGIAHEVKMVRAGHTDRSSTWGPGIPQEIMVCTGCDRFTGPWVSAAIVGGGW